MATNPYVNKVVYGNSTVMDISDTDTQESDVANGKVFYKGTGARSVGTANLDSAVWGNITGTLSNQTDLQSALDAKMSYADNGILGAKNLLPIKCASATVDGVTFTVNADGSVTANGTATANVGFTIKNNYVLNEKVILSGCVGGSANTFKLQIYDHTAGQGYNDFGDGVEVDAVGHNTLIQIVVYSGQTVNNITFYPMLRLATDTDTTYRPYAQTNKELTDSKMSYADNGVLGAKNLLKNTATSTTINAVAFTVNSDGTFTANGTASGNSSDFVINTITLKKGTYICSKSGRADGYYQISDYPITQELYAAGVNDAVFNVDTDTTFAIRFRILSGAVFSNETFKPMVRLASDPDDTYAPYAMTNKELTDSKANASDLDGWTAASTVANGSVSFSGLDDTQGWSYHPVFWVDGNSTNLNPTAELSTISGTGTSSMSVTYTTDADNGASCKLRIEK